MIVELAATTGLGPLDRGAALKDWDELKQVEAVRRSRVTILDRDYDYIPGPRFIRLVEDLARAVHPEAQL